MKKMNKRFVKKTIVFLLIFIISIGQIFTTATYAKAKLLKISNEYMEMSVSDSNGGFSINTVKGNKINKNDDNKEILFASEDYDSSFTTFRINGKDYIFGNDYNFLNTNKGIFKKVPTNNGYVNEAVWTIDGIEITQQLELVNDTKNQEYGLIRVKYIVNNTSGASVEVGARMLLDTKLGGRDYGIYQIPAAAGVPRLIENETSLSGSDIPDFYFAVDDEIGPQVIALNKLVKYPDVKKPDKIIFAHWGNISKTKWDYNINSSLYFSNAQNKNKTADSAVALYYNPVSISANSTQEFTTYYGVTANQNSSDKESLTLNLNTPVKLKVDSINQTYEKDGIFKVQAIIENPKEIGVKDYSGIVAEIQLQDGLELVDKSKNRIEILNFKIGSEKILEWEVRGNPQEYAAYKKILINVYEMQTNSSELLDVNLLISRKASVLLPSMQNKKPDVVFTSIGNNIIYKEGIRYLKVAGSGFKYYEDNSVWDLYAIGNGIEYRVPDENIAFDSENRQMTVKLTESMVTGNYQLYIRWIEEIFPGIPKEQTANSLKFTVSSDPKYRKDNYGVLAVVKETIDSKPTYKVLSYESEGAFKSYYNDENTEQDNVIVILRGGFQSNGLTDFTASPTNQGMVTINGVVDFTGSIVTVKYSDNGVQIRGETGGLGLVQTSGSKTLISKDGFEINLNNGIDYNLDKETSATSKAIKLNPIDSWNKIGQVIGGFLINLQFGLMGRDDDGYNNISFSGSLSTSFLKPANSAANTEDDSEDKEDDDTGTGSGTGSGNGSETEPGEDEDKKNEIGVAVDVQDVRFGESLNKASNIVKAGYQGIQFEAALKLGLAENVLKGMEGKLSVNTIGQYEVGVEGSVEVANMGCQFELYVKEGPHSIPIPDRIMFKLSGGNIGIPIIPPVPVAMVTGLGGGISNLYDTIFKPSVFPPITIKLLTDITLLETLEAESRLEAGGRLFELVADKVKLSATDTTILEDVGFKTSWYPQWYVSIGGKFAILDVITGELRAVASDEGFEAYGKIAIGFPSSWPLIGGLIIAGAEAGIGTEKVYGAVSIIGLRIGFIYYWGDKGVHLISPFSLVNEEIGPDTSALIGSNLFIAADSSSAEIVSENDLLKLQRQRMSIETKMYRTIDGMNQGIMLSPEKIGNMIKITYEGAEIPELEINSPSGKYDLVLLKDDLSNNEIANARIQPIKDSDGNITSNEIYVSIPEDKHQAGMWTIKSNKEIKATVIGVKNTPELKDVKAGVVGNKLNASWDLTMPTDADATASVYLSQSKDEIGYQLANKIDPNTKKISIDIPAEVQSGKYYITVVAQKEGQFYSKEFAMINNDPSNIEFNYINSKAPKAPSNVKLVKKGNGYLGVQITNENESDIDGYYVEVLDNNGDAVQGYLPFTIEKGNEIIIGGKYTLALPEDSVRTYSEEELNFGLGTNKDYMVKVAAYKDKVVNGVNSQILSTFITSSSIYLNEATPPILTLNEINSNTAIEEVYYFNTNDIKFKLGSNVGVKGKLYVDNVEVKNIDALTKDIDINTNIVAGKHLVNFVAEDEDGDISNLEFMIDVNSSKPKSMIQAPVDGQLFKNNKTTLIATVDEGSKFTVVVDGETIVDKETLISFINNKSELVYDVPLKGDKLKSIIYFRVDDVYGNTTENTISVINDEINNIDKVFIKNNAKIIDGLFLPENSPGASLELVGVTNGISKEYTLSSDQVDWNVVEGTDVITIDDNGKLKVEKSGEAIIEAAYNVSNEFSFTDAIKVSVLNLKLNANTVSGNVYKSGDKVNKDVVIRIENNGNKYEYSLDNGVTWEKYINKVTMSISEGKTLNKDILFRQEGYSDIVSFNVDISKVIPKVNDNKLLDNGKYNTDILVSFNEGIYAKLNGESILNNTIISKEGKYVLELFDYYGNSSKYNFIIDKSAPIIDVTVTKKRDNKFFNVISRVTGGKFAEPYIEVKIESMDDLTGVKNIYYKVGEEELYLQAKDLESITNGKATTIKLDKNYNGKIYAYAVDNLNNGDKAIAISRQVKVGLLPPDLSIQATEADKWSSIVNVKIQATGKDSKIKEISWEAGLDVPVKDTVEFYETKLTEKSKQVVEGGIDNSKISNGKYNLTIRATDENGLVSVESIQVKKDAIKPELDVKAKLEGSNVAYKGQETDKNVTVEINLLNKVVSGVEYYRSTDNKNWSKLTSNTEVFDKNTDKTVYYKAISGAGVESIVYQVDIKVNKDKPINIPNNSTDITDTNKVNTVIIFVISVIIILSTIVGATLFIRKKNLH